MPKHQKSRLEGERAAAPEPQQMSRAPRGDSVDATADASAAERHLTAREIADLLTRWQDPFETEHQAVRHLLGRCAHCATTAEEVRRIASEFGHWNHSFALAESAAAPELWRRLEALPFPKQLAAVAADGTYQTWGLCRLLQRLSREAAARRPAAAKRAADLANLAVAVSCRLESTYDVEWVEDLKARSYARLGNARRLLGELHGAGDAFALAGQCRLAGTGYPSVEAEAGSSSGTRGACTSSCPWPRSGARGVKPGLAWLANREDAGVTRNPLGFKVLLCYINLRFQAASEAPPSVTCRARRPLACMTAPIQGGKDGKEHRMTSTTVECFGYTWITNSQPLPPTPAAPPSPDLPAYNSNMWVPQNVAVVDGALQLTLARDSGYIWNNGFQPSNGPDQIWAAAQAVLQLPAGKQLTYGTFAVTVQPVGGWGPFVGGDTAPGQETATTFGAFTFDSAASFPYNEMDVVEIGYQNQNSGAAWINQQPGGPSNSDAQFAVQPWDSGSPGEPNWDYVHRIALDPGDIPVTFLMEWQEGQPLSFAAVREPVVYGTDIAPAITLPAPIKWLTPASIQSSIPTPTSTMSFYLNLWPYGGPSLGNPVQFNVLGVHVPLTS